MNFGSWARQQKARTEEKNCLLNGWDAGKEEKRRGPIIDSSNVINVKGKVDRRLSQLPVWRDKKGQQY